MLLGPVKFTHLCFLVFENNVIQYISEESRGYTHVEISDGGLKALIGAAIAHPSSV